MLGKYRDFFAGKNRRLENLAIFRDIGDFSAMFSSMLITPKGLEFNIGHPALGEAGENLVNYTRL